MPPNERDNSERAQRIQRIVHPDLMPELGEALHKLELIDRARQRAREANDTG